jgi:hypothetical protein
MTTAPSMACWGPWPISSHMEERVLEGKGDAQLLGGDTICSDPHLAEAHASCCDGRATPLGEAPGRCRPQPQSCCQRGLAGMQQVPNSCQVGNTATVKATSRPVALKVQHGHTLVDTQHLLLWLCDVRAARAVCWGGPGQWWPAHIEKVFTPTGWWWWWFFLGWGGEASHVHRAVGSKGGHRQSEARTTGA